VSIATATLGKAETRFGHVRHLALATFYFGLSFTWLPYPLVLIQHQIGSFNLAPDQVKPVIGYTIAAGAFFSVVVPPLVGALSDRITTPWGRRRPLMVAGMLLSLVGILLMWSAGSYPQLLIGHLVVQISLNGAAAAYYGIIPDVVPEGEYGKASGFLSVMTASGALLGFATTTVLSTLHAVIQSYLVMAVVLALSVLPVLWAGSEEGKRPVVHRRLPLRAAIADFFRPMWGSDFAWVIFTRMMVTGGIAAVAYFLSPFFKDVVKVDNPDQFTSIWLGVAFAAMIVPGLLGGAGSDRHGRKRFVYAAGTLQIAVAAFFIVFYPTQIWIVLSLAVVYGLGYGLYVAVDWALACDTVPDRAKSAKDMGLFHVGQTLPNSIIPAIEGVLITYFNSHAANSGYRVAFGSVILFFLLGTVFVSRIRSVR
jgi:MFS family permease